MSEQNPFLANQESSGGGNDAGSFDPAGRHVGIDRVIGWYQQGWQLFVKNPGIWIANVVILAVILIILNFIPILGSLAVNFLMPVFAGGLLLGCKSLSADGPFGVDSLFAGFKHNTGNLILVSVFYLIGVIIIMAIAFLVGGGTGLMAGMMGGSAGFGMAMGSVLLIMLIIICLMVPLLMALWFAPALVVFRDVAPLDAMKASFSACLKNIVPFLVYGIVYLVLAVVATIPLGLGWLVLAPVLIGSVYASYVEIFE